MLVSNLVLGFFFFFNVSDISVTERYGLEKDRAEKQKKMQIATKVSYTIKFFTFTCTELYCTVLYAIETETPRKKKKILCLWAHWSP